MPRRRIQPPTVPSATYGTELAPRRTQAPATPSAQAPPDNRYVVRPGDSLWSIASARLGAGASSAAIAAEVHRLWKLNAAAIEGGDPNLIKPGQQLRLS